MSMVLSSELELLLLHSISQLDQLLNFLLEVLVVERFKQIGIVNLRLYFVLNKFIELKIR